MNTKGVQDTEIVGIIHVDTIDRESSEMGSATDVWLIDLSESITVTEVGKESFRPEDKVMYGTKAQSVTLWERLKNYHKEKSD